MKNIIYTLTACMLLCAYSYCQTSSANASRKILATLQPNEYIVTDESCLPVAVSDNNFFLVTRLGDNFYTCENGQRKGPYKSLKAEDIKACGDNSFEVGCAVYQGEESAPDNSLLSVTDDGKYVINFNGKKYGPVQFISQIHVSPDRSSFVALGMDDKMKMYLLTSAGVNTILEGTVEALNISPSGRNYVFAVKENSDQVNPFMSKDMSNMTPEEIMKIAQEYEAKLKAAGPPQTYIYSGNGPKIGPFDAKEFSGRNPAFTKTGGENWIMIVDNTLYVNGKVLQKFEGIDLQACRVWLSKDGKRFAVVSYEDIRFSDGSSFPYPLKMGSFEKDGKTLMRWVALENERELVEYTREL
jgi:hypothetical protein